MRFINNSNVHVDIAMEALEYGIMYMLCLQEKCATKQQYKKINIIYRYYSDSPLMAVQKWISS